MAYKYENVTPTSNTLWNDDPNNKIINYAEQVKDATVDWTSFHYVDEDGNIVQPFIGNTDADKFQSKLNDIFLTHYNNFQEFLHSKGVDGVIDTWKDIEDFLAGVSDSETITLENLIEQSELVRGTMNIAMSQTIPGMLEATTNVLVPNIEDSHIDEETGIIRMVYKFE